MYRLIFEGIVYDLFFNFNVGSDRLFRIFLLQNSGQQKNKKQQQNVFQYIAVFFE